MKSLRRLQLIMASIYLRFDVAKAAEIEKSLTSDLIVIANLRRRCYFATSRLMLTAELQKHFDLDRDTGDNLKLEGIASELAREAFKTRVEADTLQKYVDTRRQDLRIAAIFGDRHGAL